MAVKVKLWTVLQISHYTVHWLFRRSVWEYWEIWPVSKTFACPLVKMRISGRCVYTLYMHKYCFYGLSQCILWKELNFLALPLFTHLWQTLSGWKAFSEDKVNAHCLMLCFIATSQTLAFSILRHRWCTHSLEELVLITAHCCSYEINFRIYVFKKILKGLFLTFLSFST